MMHEMYVDKGLLAFIVWFDNNENPYNINDYKQY